MKNKKLFVSVLSMAAILALLLSACGSADAGPVTLTVTGLVDNELSLTDADLHDMDIANISAEHPKNGMQDYSGVRINDLLDEAGVQEGAATLVLTAGDGYSFEIDLATVRDCADCLVAFGDTAGDYMSVLPGQASKGWVKGLVGIEVK